MSITQTVNLNMIPDSAPVIVRVNQYDTGTGRLVFKLFNGAASYTPGAGATVAIQGTKPDKHGFYYDTPTLSGDTVTADLTEQMSCVYGAVRCQLVVTETSGKTGTFAFTLKVQQSALEDDTDISETEIPALEDLAERNAERAEAAAAHYPYINEDNEHWMVWDVETEQFVDTGISAAGAGGNIQDSIAPTYSTGVAPTGGLSAGDEFYLSDGILYRATTTISAGSAIVTSGGSANAEVAPSITEQIVTLDTDKCETTVIGNVEDGAKPSKSYAVGEHMIRGGKFCTVTSPVTTGSTWTLNTNYVEGTVAESVQAWAEFTLTESIVGILDSKSYAVSDGKIVIINLMLSAHTFSSGNTNILTIPSGYRPKKTSYGTMFDSASGKVVMAYAVDTSSGNLTIYTSETLTNATIRGSLVYKI